MDIIESNKNIIITRKNTNKKNDLDESLFSFPELSN